MVCMRVCGALQRGDVDGVCGTTWELEGYNSGDTTAATWYHNPFY